LESQKIKKPKKLLKRKMQILFFIIIFSPLLSTPSAQPHFTNTIEFLHSPANRNHTQQTLFLLATDALTTTNASHLHVRLNASSAPFRLTRPVHSPNLVFISLLNKRLDLQASCQPNYTHTYSLDLLILQAQTLVNSVHLNVHILNEIPCARPLRTLERTRLSVEYIFQLNSDASFGLIKDDMPRNGIVAIVKLVDAASNKSLDIILDRASSQVALKKFLPNFYMLRLLETPAKIGNGGYFEVRLHVAEGLTDRLDSTTLRFKLVRADELTIGFGEQAGVVDVTVANFFTEYASSGAFLYQVRPNLGKLLSSLQPEFNVDLDAYLRTNIRYEMSNFSNSVSLDPRSGSITLGKATLAAELISVNVTAVDKRKLLRTNSIIVNIKVLNRRGEGREQQEKQQQTVVEQSIQVESTNGLILADLSVHDSVNEFDRLAACWVNGLRTNQFYLNLNNRLLAAFSRLDSLQMRLIECQLAASNTWLKLHVSVNQPQQKTSHRIVSTSRVVDVDVQQQRVILDLKSLLDVEALNQKRNDNTQLVFSFSQGQSDFQAGRLFQVEASSGLVSCDQALLASTWSQLSLAKLTFDIRLVQLLANVSVGLDLTSDTPFLMQDSQELTSLNDVPVYLNLISNTDNAEDNDFQLQLHFETIARLNNRFFPVRIVRIQTGGKLEFMILQVCPPVAVPVLIEVVNVIRLDLDRSLTDQPAAIGLFTVDKGLLLYRPSIHSTKRQNVYFLTISACSADRRQRPVSAKLFFYFLK
jgi:hypothetical protein